MADTERPAQIRTDLAEDRTLLANERTFAGWLRTSFAAVGIGLGFHVLFRAMEPPWLPRAIATVFLLVAIAVAVAADRRACAVRGRLSPHEIKAARSMNIRLITCGVTVATLTLIGAIWLAPLS